MKKKASFCVSVLAMIALMLNSAAIGSALSDNVKAYEEVQEASLTEKVNSSEDSYIIEEDISLRGKYEKHFLMSDGEYMACTYDEPVHMQRNGEWVEIDNTLQSVDAADGNARLATKNGLSKVSFAQTPSEQLVTMENSGHTISWDLQVLGNLSLPKLEKFQAFEAEKSGSILGETSDYSSVRRFELDETVRAQVKEIDYTALDAKEQKTAVKSSVSKLSYEKVLGNDIDINYFVLPTRVKEEIILNTPQEISAYIMTVTTGLQARLLENRQIEFYHEDEVIFTMWAPYMYDSAGMLSEDITVEMTGGENGTYTVTMVPDADWLNDPERVYPVVIDPDVSPSSAQTNGIDNFVWDGSGVQTSNLDRMYIGMYREKSTTPRYKARAFQKFNTMPTIPAGSTITSATQTFKITDNTKTGSYASAFRVTEKDWSSSAITWANQPAAATSIAISGNNITQSENLSTLKLNMLSTVQAWYSGSTTGKNKNYGVMLRYATETVQDYNAFYSADCATTASRPALTIGYTVPSELSEITSGAVYYIRNKNSNKYLDARQSLNNDVIQYSYHGELNQQWKITHIGNGIYTIKNLYYSYNGKVLDVLNGDSANGTNIQVWGSNNTNAQKWKIIKNNDGTYTFVSAISSSKVVDVEGNSLESMANIHLWDFHGGNNQRWYFERAYNYGYKGYAFYCTLPAYLPEWHAGFMNEPYATNHLPVIHMSSGSSGIGVQWAEWNDVFILGSQYKKICRPKQAMSDYYKGAVIDLARELRTKNISYSLTMQMSASVYPNAYWIWPEDIFSLRCDGLVEYCYEYYGFRIFGDDLRWDITRSDAVNLAHHGTPASGITPSIQANSYMKTVGTNVPNPVP